jgi:hypothetical protein
MTEEKKLKRQRRKKRKLERQSPNPATLFAKERARAERDPNYSIVITNPRKSRKPWSDISS